VIFYLLAGALTAVALAFLLRPLLGRQRVSEGDPEELAVYRAQLADLERDLAAGTLTPEAAEASRREVERRLLAADAAGRRAAGAGRPALGFAVLLAVLLLVGGPALYLVLGAPDQPAQPYAGRPEVQMQRALLERAEVLRAGLAETPDDFAGWQELGMMRSMLGQAAAAAEAYRQALRLEPDSAEMHAALAEALIAQAGGEVTAEARQSLSQALDRDPNESLALYYVGHAMEQDGRFDMALQLWREMAAGLPEGSRWRTRLDADIRRVEARAGAPKNAD